MVLIDYFCRRQKVNYNFLFSCRDAAPNHVKVHLHGLWYNFNMKGPAAKQVLSLYVKSDGFIMKT